MAGAMGGFLAGSIVAKMELDKGGWNSSITAVKNDLGDVKTKSSLAGSAMGSLAGQFTLGNLAANAIQKGLNLVVSELQSIFAEAMQSEDALRNLDTVLASTGGTTGLTKGALVDMAKALQDVTTYSDETVMAAEAMLLRFKSIGQDVFPRVLDSVTNVAAALKIDLVNAAESVGRALEDPTTAARNLRSMNILLSDEQKRLIEKFVETGDAASAQNLILGELERAYGGAAKAAGETLSGKLAILKNQYNELKEQIGLAVLPALKSFLDQIIPIVKDIVSWTEKNRNLLDSCAKLAVNIEGLALTFKILAVVLETSKDIYDHTIGQLEKLGTFGEGLKDALLLLPALLDELSKKAKDTGDKFGGFGTVLGDLWDRVDKGVDTLRNAAGGFLNLDEMANKFKVSLKSEIIKEIENTEKALKKLKDSTETTPGAIKILNDKLKDLKEYLNGTKIKFNEVAIAARDMGPFIFNSGVQFKELALDVNATLLPALDKTKTALMSLAMGFDLTPFVEKQETALTASEQAWLNFKQNVAQNIGDIVVDCFRIPKGLDDALGELPPIFEGIFKVIYKSFSEFVSALIAKWITDFLTNTLVNKTAETAKTIGNTFSDLAKTATGAISGAATSALNTISGFITAGASLVMAATALFKKEDYSQITFWLKPISEATRQTADWLMISYMAYVAEWNSLFLSDNYCLYELHGRLVETRDAISYWGGAIVDAVKGIKGAQHGYVAMSNELVMVHGTPSIPEIILPEPIYEQNLQMAAAMGGGQPGRPIELYINGEPVKFPMKENMRKIMIDLVPYMSKNEQLKIHPRSVRAF